MVRVARVARVNERPDAKSQGHDDDDDAALVNTCNGGSVFTAAPRKSTPGGCYEGQKSRGTSPIPRHLCQSGDARIDVHDDLFGSRGSTGKTTQLDVLKALGVDVDALAKELADAGGLSGVELLEEDFAEEDSVEDVN